eukprot:TRINITY_DN4297_c2_g1_i1.p2 TRINITY_DN4297_c2_g1~~TRINITY_DN4297_c2_g1_i1.p2  ORF type:complete len:165 (+),score=16.18 TRINITY_DN4297_c2_g1_i1:205-699(+)
MKLPPGISSSSRDEVAHLRRSLYGLKQAPRAWFENFRDALLRLHFQQSPYDPSLFLHRTLDGITVLLVYVDDIIISGTDSSMIRQLQASLNESFHMKDLGPLTYFLGLEVHHSEKGIILDQHKYSLRWPVYRTLPRLILLLKSMLNCLRIWEIFFRMPPYIANW